MPLLRSNKNTFPKAKCFRKGYLQVSDGNPIHKIYYQEYGKKKGDPVIFLHGGPGGGATEKDTVFFDPKHYRIILLDQRGAGKSTPFHSLVENTTQHLVDDINRLRDHLKIKEKAHIFGGSWGSTLALAYAIAHPDKVKSLTLRGIFLCRKRDIDILCQGNSADPSKPQTSPAAIAFPDAWRQYVEFIPQEERHNMLVAYHNRLNDERRDIQLEAARCWSKWEGAASKLVPDEAFIKDYEKDEFALAFARIETHYFLNGAFFRESGDDDQDFLRQNIYKIAQSNIPAEIVQGRYDLVCPRYQADELYEAWANATDKPPSLHIVTAGHNAKEPEILKTLIAITQRMKTLPRK